ncbi:MAG: site-specific DNA-methyltransferase [Ruminococcus sp.]|nr:site-specific DNA-methyltransferase [Ruminococcus sp.]
MKSVNDIKGRIFNDRSDRLLKEFPAECIDLVVTSPPYDDLRDYEGVASWDMEVFQTIARELYRVMKPGGVVVWVVGDKTLKGSKTLTSFKQALFFQEIGFDMYDVIIYEKAGSGPPHPNRYFNAFEYMFVLSKGRPKTVNILRDKPNKWAGCSTYGEVTRREKDGSLTNKGRKVISEFGVRTNIWRYANGRGFATKDKLAYKHPAIFPEKLAEDHIASWSDPGDLVLDPFGGSGTTAKAAQKMGREWVLIEAVKDYCEIARERLVSIQNADSDN